MKLSRRDSKLILSFFSTVCFFKKSDISKVSLISLDGKPLVRAIGWWHFHFINCCSFIETNRLNKVLAGKVIDGRSHQP